MTFRNLFAREILIRLTENSRGFHCTVRRGPFPAKSSEIPVSGPPAPLSPPTLEPCRTAAGRKSVAVPDESRP